MSARMSDIAEISLFGSPATHACQHLWKTIWRVRDQARPQNISEAGSFVYAHCVHAALSSACLTTGKKCYERFGSSMRSLKLPARCAGMTRKGTRCSITALSNMKDDRGMLVGEPLAHGGSIAASMQRYSSTVERSVSQKRTRCCFT